MKRWPLLLATALFLSGCGLRPLYGGVDSPARSTLAGVEVAPIALSLSLSALATSQPA